MIMKDANGRHAAHTFNTIGAMRRKASGCFTF